MSLVIVPEVRITPSLLWTSWGLDWIRWGEGEEREEGIAGTEGEIVANNRSFKMCRPSLHGALVEVTTVVMAITAAAVTATREVALPRWDDAMVMCDGDKAS